MQIHCRWLHHVTFSMPRNCLRYVFPARYIHTYALTLTSTRNSRLILRQRLLIGLVQAHISGLGLDQTFHRPIRASSAAKSCTYPSAGCYRPPERSL